jgi:hypothetical protein
LSGQHTVTKGLFTEDSVVVQGLDWCKEPKTIGLSSLTRKILCTHHNSKLSLVDDAAIAAFNAFRKSVQLTDIREKIKERRWAVLHLPVDGAKLERWFLKTLINITIGGKSARSRIHPEDPLLIWLRLHLVLANLFRTQGCTTPGAAPFGSKGADFDLAVGVKGAKRNALRQFYWIG